LTGLNIQGSTILQDLELEAFQEINLLMNILSQVLKEDQEDYHHMENQQKRAKARIESKEMGQSARLNH
jgi:hypothetical protein